MQTKAPLYDRLDKSTIPSCDLGVFMYVTDDSGPRLEKFDPSKLSFGEPVRQAYGGSNVPVLYYDQPMRVQTPRMCLPFGLTVYNNTRGKSYVMDLSFKHKDQLEPTRWFFNLMRTLDGLTLAEGIRQRKKWLPAIKETHYGAKELWKLYIAMTRQRESKNGGRARAAPDHKGVALQVCSNPPATATARKW